MNEVGHFLFWNLALWRISLYSEDEESDTIGGTAAWGESDKPDSWCLAYEQELNRKLAAGLQKEWPRKPEALRQVEKNMVIH